jgi:hypothetical protein
MLEYVAINYKLYVCILHASPIVAEFPRYAS